MKNNGTGLAFKVVKLEVRMIRGIYTNSSAMQYLQEKMDVVANNVANSTTNGFKRSGLFQDQLMGAEQANNRNKIQQALPEGEIKTYVEFTQGGSIATNNKLDFSIGGDGFFSIQTPNGTAYTRDGQFTVNQEGVLVTASGYPVLGKAGQINVQGEKISVSEEGIISIDGTEVNKFDMKSFDIKQGEQREDNLWITKNQDVEVKDANPQIRQGYLETSNVSIVKEMVDMIAIQRWYQANERSIRTNDDALNKAVNQIAR
jgi:flagellar basal-body rod protein FlgG